MMRALFDHYVEHPPPPLTADATDEQRVVDWLAGMTDRFAIARSRTCRCRRGSEHGAVHTRLDRPAARRDRHGRLVSEKTDLRRVGSRWTGLCPFHDERTPSFSVNAEEKLFYCFGCQAKGDAIGSSSRPRGSTSPRPWSGWRSATAWSSSARTTTRRPSSAGAARSG